MFHSASFESLVGNTCFSEKDNACRYLPRTGVDKCCVALYINRYRHQSGSHISSQAKLRQVEKTRKKEEEKGVRNAANLKLSSEPRSESARCYLSR